MADHPFRAAWRTRDLDEWIEALSPEIVLRSPVVRKLLLGGSKEILATTVKEAHAIHPQTVIASLGSCTDANSYRVVAKNAGGSVESSPIDELVHCR